MTIRKIKTFLFFESVGNGVKDQLSDQIKENKVNKKILSKPFVDAANAINMAVYNFAP